MNNHALGLGAMNLHGFFVEHGILLQFTRSNRIYRDLFFYTISYYAFKASNKIAIENGKSYYNFDKSEYANGIYFEKYTAKMNILLKVRLLGIYL